MKYFLAIAPYYLDLFFAPPPLLDPEAAALREDVGKVEGEKGEEDENMFTDVGRIIQVLRIARLMRIFKLARRSVGLQSMAHTVKTSWKVRSWTERGVIASTLFCPGSRLAILSGHHGNALLRQPGVLHR